MNYHKKCCHAVLIETYWNVKVGKPLPFKNHFESINRNILECKVVYSQMRIRPAIGINRNILECKVSNRFRIIFLNNRINRNILECKERRQQKQAGGSQMY